METENYKFSIVPSGIANSAQRVREELIEDWGFEVTVTESKGMKPREPKTPTT
jgi:F420-0:gamma-glutamyl ligase